MRAGPWVIVSVRDHGPGVAQESSQLTTPFFRGDAARTAPTGAGLGLAIVEKAMQRMGGSLELQPTRPTADCWRTPAAPRAMMPLRLQRTKGHQGGPKSSVAPMNSSPNTAPAASSPSPAGSEPPWSNAGSARWRRSR